MPTTQFQILDGSIVVDGAVNGQPIQFIVDTGDAIGPTFNSADADSLKLPDLGPLEVSGAGGSVAISKTQADITLGNTTYTSESSAIDSNLQGPSLLGLPFFLRQEGTLCFDFETNQLSFGAEMPERRSLWAQFLKFWS